MMLKEDGLSHWSEQICTTKRNWDNCIILSYNLINKDDDIFLVIRKDNFESTSSSVSYGPSMSRVGKE